MKYEEVKADYYRLKELVGAEVSDFCGAWCNCDVLDDMLNNPTKRKACFYFERLIDRYFEIGSESRNYDNVADKVDLSNPEIYELAKKYGHIGSKL